MIKDDLNENFEKYNNLIDYLRKFLKEFEESNKTKEKEKEVNKKIIKRKETRIYQLVNNHELYKFYQLSNFFRGKLTLLDEKQAFDENDSFQKIMDLFLEESDTITNISNNRDISGGPNKYLLTQLFTAFSLLTRKIYLNGDKIESGGPEEKGREFIKHLNSVKFNKNSKITNQMLELFNHNILRIEDIYQDNDNEEKNYNKENDKKINLDKYEKKEIIEAYEIKKKVPYEQKVAMDPFNTFEVNNENVILNNDNKEEAVQQVDSISYEKHFDNIDLDNENYKKEKSTNMRKILELDDEKLKNISIGEFQELISEVYENGTLLNKDIEDKITGGQGKLFTNESSVNKKFSFSKISDSNEIEMSNIGEKIIDDEEIMDDANMLDFEQEEIKNDENKNSFFEKGEDFPKDLFQHNSDEDEKSINKQMETISHNENLDFSKSQKSKKSSFFN